MPKIPGFLDFVIQIPFLGSGPNSQIDFFEMDLFQPLIFFLNYRTIGREWAILQRIYTSIERFGDGQP